MSGAALNTVGLAPTRATAANVFKAITLRPVEPALNAQPKAVQFAQTAEPPAQLVLEGFIYSTKSVSSARVTAHLAVEPMFAPNSSLFINKSSSSLEENLSWPFATPIVPLAQTSTLQFVLNVTMDSSSRTENANDAQDCA